LSGSGEEQKSQDPNHDLIKGLTPEQSKAIFDNPDLSGLTREEIKAQVEARVSQEDEQRRAENKEAAAAPPAPGEVDSKFVLDCLAQNEVGDGRLYAALHRGKYVYNKTDQNWYSWSGHHWERDIMNSALAAVENVTDRYLQEAVNLSYKRNDAVKDGKDEEVKKIKADIELVYKRASRLRTDRGRRNCVACAHTKYEPLAVPGDGFDLDPWVLACKNGVLDLRTGELRPGRPDEFILRACPHEWKGINEPAPEYERFMQTTFGNQDLISYLDRLFGYSLTGLTSQRKFIMFHGQGQNGKGILIETLLYVLGPLASPIQSEMLLDQGRSRSAAGPSPDIMALKGLRIAVASETDEGRRFSSSRVKWLSGGDTLVGRSPFAQQEISFTPTHILYLLTNNKPHASAYDFAMWERMILIPFKISFVNRKPRADNERPADLNLQQTLQKEAPGILARWVRGCIEWQERGLDPPAIVLDATLEYKREEDILEDFIEEHCYRNPEAKSGASDLYDTFNEWFLKNVSKKGMSQKKFGRLLQAAGFEKVKSGTFSYLGLGLLAG
jgi:putative DNA primase/helicase